MSGGSGGSGGTDRPNGDDLICENIQFSTTLNSPQPDVIDALEVGDQLTIATSGPSVVALSPSGDIAGSINWASNSRLIQCMEEGTEYVAQVLTKDGGHVRVRVTAAR